MSLVQPRKTRSDKGKKREQRVKRARLQAVLSDKTPRQASAMVILEHLRNSENRKDTYILTEALCAYGEMTDKGWKPAPYLTQVVINDQIYKALNSLTEQIERLSQLDFNGAPNQGAIQTAINTARQFTIDTQNLVGGSMFYDEDED